MLARNPTLTNLIYLLLLSSASATPIPDPAPAALAAPGQVAPPTKLQARAPQPSRRMGQRRSKKSEPLKKKDYSSFLCPGGSVACPIVFDAITEESVTKLDGSLNSLADWFKVGFECMELDTELNSCGGCLALGAGSVSSPFFAMSLSSV